MPWLAIGIGVSVIVVFITIVVIVGSNLPREHVAAVRVRYNASPETVWAILRDPLAAGSWRKDVKKVESVADVNGHPAWREESGFGTVTFELTESTKPVSFTTRIVNDDLPFGGEWDHRLTVVGTGTELTITERGHIKPAFFRFMARYLFGYTSTIKGYLTELGAKLGEQVVPEVVSPGH
jgi:hypothetical protein